MPKSSPRVHIEIDLSQMPAQLAGKALIEACRRITAERAARRTALGVPQGFTIPDDPIPATAEECRAEMAIVERLEIDAYHLSISLPPGQERESAGAAMVHHRDRRWRLMCAIRDGDVVKKPRPSFS